MKVQDILTDESKWCKGAMEWRGQRCLAGSILKLIDNGAPDGALILNKIRAHLKIGSGGEWNSVAEWNDAPERTFADVRGLIEELGI